MPRSIDSTARAEIENQIAAFVTAGQSFTALHVTNALRSAQTWAGTFGHMRGIAPEVRNAYDNGRACFDVASGDDDYSRTLVNINGRDVYVHHPSGDDPHSIDLSTSPVSPVDISIFNNQAPDQPADVATPTTVQPGPRNLSAPTGVQTAREMYNGGKSASDGDTCKVTFNGDGDAQIPRAMTRALGLDAGDGVVVEGQSLSGTCTLRAARPGETFFARLQPTNGALRLRDDKLMGFGVGNAPDLTVTLDTTAGTLTLR